MQDHRGCWREDESESKRIEIDATERKIMEKVIEQAEIWNKLKNVDRKESIPCRSIIL